MDSLLKLHYESDLHEVAISCYRLAKLHYDATNFKLAESFFIKAINNLSPTEDIFTILKSLRFLMKISDEGNDQEKFQLYLNHAHAIIKKMTLPERETSPHYYYNKAIIHLYLKEYQEAKDSFHHAIDLLTENCNTRIHSYVYLAIVHYELMEFDTALTYLEIAQEDIKDSSSVYFAATCNFWMGKINFYKGRNLSAIDYFNDALMSMQTKKYWHLYANILFWMGKTYQEMGDNSKAVFLFELTERSLDHETFHQLSINICKELSKFEEAEIDIYLDKAKKMIYEKNVGLVDFKHRFVLLDILFLLATNPGKYYDKETLAKYVWSNNYNPLIHDKLIYTSICRLRNLIEPNSKHSYILRGKEGYAFNQLARAKFFLEEKHLVSFN